jgi:hypothetical protein
MDAFIQLISPPIPPWAEIPILNSIPINPGVSFDGSLTPHQITFLFLQSNYDLVQEGQSKFNNKRIRYFYLKCGCHHHHDSRQGKGIH